MQTTVIFESVEKPFDQSFYQKGYLCGEREPPPLVKLL